MKITAVAGGIGASKFLLGLTRILPPEDITVIANTGDDIELFGLRISPDIDTITYTLAGVINETTGWGIAGDTFSALEWIARYGESRWFNLGDRDLATHIYRTEQLQKGRTLSEVTDHVRRSLGVSSVILPMTNAYTPPPRRGLGGGRASAILKNFWGPAGASRKCARFALTV